MKLFILLLFIISLTSCQKKQHQNAIIHDGNTNIENSAEFTAAASAITRTCNDTNENNIAAIHFDNFGDIYKYFSVFCPRPLETVLFKDAALYDVDRDEDSFIKTIPAGTEIVILAKNSSYSDHYLIKLKNDNSLWSGWIKEDSVPQNVNEYSFLPLRDNVSTRNDFFASFLWRQMDETGDFVVVKKNGDILYIITGEEIMEKFSTDFPGIEVNNWSADQSKIWFTCSGGASIEGIGMIDLKNRAHTFFELPPLYDCRYHVIDPEIGEIYYGDYFRPFDSESAEDLKKLKETYNLYSYNFFTKEHKKIDSNIGEGFNIKYDKKNGFTYEKEDYF